MTDKDKARVNAALHEKLNKLKGCALIDDATYGLFVEKIRSSKYVHEMQLLTELTLEIEHAERIAPGQLHPFADSLWQYRIVSDIDYSRLRLAIDSGKIMSHFQLLDYCEHGVAFNLAEYPDAPADYLHAIHARTAELFPELEFTGFSHRIVVDSLLSDSIHTSTNVIVSLTCSGQLYQHESFISTASIPGNEYLGKIDQQEFYQIFNKILADKHSPYRLYLVSPDIIYSGYRNFGVIGLTEGQADDLHRGGGLFDISYEDHRDLLTSEKIRDAIEVYRELGLLNHLSDEQISMAKEKVARSRSYTFNDVLSHFPAVIHNFDTELGNLEDPYRELLHAYKEISHDLFSPDDIVDEFNLDQRHARLQFTLNKKAYTTMLQVESDWIDHEFFSVVDQAVEENNLPGRFYFLAGDGQFASVIFLTEKQYEALKERQLLAFGSE
jgi:hypothetical protein